MSFNLSVRASARSFTVPMVGIGLGVLSGIGLPGVIGSGLAELPGQGGKEVTSECSEEDSHLSCQMVGEWEKEFPLSHYQAGLKGEGLLIQ